MHSRPVCKPLVALKEEEVQASIIDGLTLMRFTVLQASRRRFLIECPRCGHRFRPKGGDGADKGVPDLIITSEAWPQLVWLGLEVKGTETKVSPEQQSLAERGHIAVVRSWDEAVEIVRAFDNTMRKAAAL